ncbi:MAG: Flagellar protein FliO [Pseudomonadota bacterium]|jgi:flagellar protein FliO/FliZ
MEPTSLELFRLIASLVLVFGLLGGLLWALKKMQHRLQGASPNRKMALIESLSLAPRQKIALIQIGEQQLVVGITPTSITPLMTVAADGAVQVSAQVSAPATSPTAFKEELQRV